MQIKVGGKVNYRLSDGKEKQALIIRINPEWRLNLLIFFDAWMKGYSRYIEDVPRGTGEGQWQPV